MKPINAPVFLTALLAFVLASVSFDASAQRKLYRWTDKDGTTRPMQARDIIVVAPYNAQVNALRDAGRLLVAGPCPAIDAEDPGPAGFSGSLVIAQFASLEEARAWADADPYVEAGVYARV